MSPQQEVKIKLVSLLLPPKMGNVRCEQQLHGSPARSDLSDAAFKARVPGTETAGCLTGACAFHVVDVHMAGLLSPAAPTRVVRIPSTPVLEQISPMSHRPISCDCKVGISLNFVHATRCQAFDGLSIILVLRMVFGVDVGTQDNWVKAGTLERPCFSDEVLQAQTRGMHASSRPSPRYSQSFTCSTCASVTGEAPSGAMWVITRPSNWRDAGVIVIA